MLRLVVLFPLMLIFDGPLGEEIGWRGLLLPQLLKTMSPIGASVVATSFIFTWFYLKSGCSTFVAILLHATTNFALFLVIKSFNISNTTTLSHIHDALIAIVAAFALVYFWGRSEAQLAIAATRH
jgi:membrane protease YdiL (CAAX protease family)